MKKTFALLTVIYFLGISFAIAESSLQAEVDKNTLTTDETLTYKVTVTSTEKNISRLQLPEFKDFRLISNSQSSNISFLQGKANTTLVYTFILAPLQEGKFKIEPSRVTIGDKTYSTEPIEIEVKQGRPRPKIKPQEPSLPKETLPENEEFQVTL